MNCDQAFDVMTSSRRASDRGLPVHLAGCPRCREMQETLQPALGMFQADAILSQPIDPWDVPSEGGDVATHAARRLSTADTPRRGVNALWGYAAAVILGAGLVWSTVVLNPSANLSPGANPAKEKCLYLSDSRPIGMTARQMMQSCLACHAVTELPSVTENDESITNSRSLALCDHTGAGPFGFFSPLTVPGSCP